MNSYQYYTFNRMVGPDYDGSKSISSLDHLFSFGIGTFHALDGELVVNDNKIFHCRDGKAQQANGNVPIAWAWLYNFHAPQEVASNSSFSGIADMIKDCELSILHDLVGIKISGKFSVLKLTSTQKQEKPYPTIERVIDQARDYYFTEIEGTAVGCYVPHSLSNVQNPGLYLHFINSKLDVGGHVLDFYTNEDSIKLEKIKYIQLEL